METVIRKLRFVPRLANKEKNDTLAGRFELLIKGAWQLEMLKFRPTFIEPIKALVADDPMLDSPSKQLTIRSGSEYLATDMMRRNYEIPMKLDLEAIAESPEKVIPRRASSPTKRRSLPSNALIIDEVKPCRREKEKIKSELLDEWKKEKVYVDKYLSSTRCKLKVSNKKHPLNRLRKIAYSIIWMNKLHRPAVKKIDDPVVYR